jgi:hypothetical protein
MAGAFSGFDGFEIFFLLCAVIGGFFVLFRFILQFVGVGTDLDTDGPPALDVHHADSDIGFKLLSLQGFSAFLLMFGLVGLALYRQSGAGFFFSIVGGSVAGLAAVWVVGKLFALAVRLQSSGTLDSGLAAPGCSGTVYLKIPAGGTGQVTVTISGRQREMNAVAADGGELPTGTPVRVVRSEASILVVERIS